MAMMRVPIPLTIRGPAMASCGRLQLLEYKSRVTQKAEGEEQREARGKKPRQKRFKRASAQQISDPKLPDYVLPMCSIHG